MVQFPSVAECERISAFEDPVVRNLQITQCYAELSSFLISQFGPVANWCTFATWASKQAGQTIRSEDLNHSLEQWLAREPGLQQAFAGIIAAIGWTGRKHPEDAVRALIWDALDPRAAMERASESVARGNQKVFAEIGREFARFITECLDKPVFNPEIAAAFCDALRSGDPPDGQGYLRQAFGHYSQALSETVPAKQKELLFLANLEIGFHEQTRLQPEITEALEASMIDPSVFTRRLLVALFPYRGRIINAFWWLLRKMGRPSRLDAAFNRFLTSVRSHIRQFLTEHMMVLTFPHRRLKLGTDLGEPFPESLKHLSHPELLELLRKIDPTPDSLRDSGAVDWANLSDRIHFIADLFRCYNERPELLETPFTSEQLRILKAGQLPTGPL